LFFFDKLGLKKGDKVKQQVDIPDWIKQNRLYSIACLRGLVDTDGCIFTHSYRVNDKLYRYKKFSFTNSSKFLRQSVFAILKDNGLNPRMSQRKDVRLDSVSDIKKYFQLIGSHNPKHLKRFKN
jgi:intein/homing endonuclease